MTRCVALGCNVITGEGVAIFESPKKEKKKKENIKEYFDKKQVNMIDNLPLT